ncbi:MULTISPECIES: phage major capsid protein [unclassified Sphingomonas]|uniref:phage major capsid protein n=1 Tax=Sphingomonas sp. PvP015 TaxID=3156388 RepID=UPI00339A2806
MFTDKLLRHQEALRNGVALPMPPISTKNAKTLDQVLDDHISVVTKALEKAKEGQKSSEDKLAELSGEITDLAQKMDSRGVHGRSESQAESAGNRFLREKATDVAQLAGQRGEIALSMRAAVTSGAASGGALAPEAEDGVVILPRRKLMVRDLLPVIRITAGSVEYPKQTTRTNNAAPVAEGDLKPESQLAWALQTAQVRTIAHYVMASRQILEDAPQLAGLINEDLLFGLRDVEDLQLVMGDGLGQNLTGMYPAATAYSAPYALTAPNKMDRIGSALLQLALADYNADGIIMHPSDWLRIKLLKDAAGGYLTADPISGKSSNGDMTERPMLWGVPVIPTKSMAVGKFLVGEFRAAVTLYDRWEVRIEASTQDRDNFIRNLCTILGEERVALAIKQAGALVRGDFSADA